MALQCPRCSAEVGLELGATFARCPYCTAAIVRSGDAVLVRYVVPARLTADAARRALDRWMVGNEPSRHLAGGAQIDAPELAWLPVWYARVHAEDAPEHVETREARATDASLPEVKRRLIPASGMRRLERDGEDLPPPTIAWDVFARAELEGDTIVERALVHVPFFRFAYRFRGRRYTAAVDATAGEVRPGRYPKRPTLPFRLLSVTAFGLFLAADAGLAYHWFGDADRPRFVHVVYPFAWLASMVLARLLVAVF